MNDLDLFQDAGGSWITSSHIRALLEKTGAADARVLYIHTGLTFGPPNPKLSRREMLDHLYGLIASLGVPTICVPTYTFSFCNGEDYNVQTSRSQMGALNEHIRKLPAAVRSRDPLLSTALVGEDRDLVENLGKHSIGEDSTFDRLHRHGGNARFLFFGALPSQCFTYLHYVEERLKVPYRYDREFTGKITDGDRTWEDTYTLFVRYKGVLPTSRTTLEDDLLAQGLLRRETCGASSISSVKEPDAYEAMVRHLKRDPLAFLDAEPGDRNREFAARNMVAL